MTHDPLENLERQLLVTVVEFPQALGEIQFLENSDFRYQRHEAIYRACRELSSRGVPVDWLTLTEGLRASGWLQEAGGDAYLLDLARLTPSGPSFASQYAQEIRGAGVRRKMRIKFLEAAEKCKDPATPLTDLATLAEEAALLGVGYGEKDLTHASQFLPQITQQMEAQAKGEITGLRTGFYDIDLHLCGFQKSDLITLGGRPRMGKTALAGDIAANVAFDQKKTVAFFELEMTSQQIVRRQLLARAGVNGQLLKSGRLPQRDYPRIALAMPQVSESRLYLDDSVDLTPLQMTSKLRRLKARHGLDLVILDNIQRMRADISYGANRRLEITEITRSLKNIAKELDVPILAISHLSRGVDTRPDHEPVMSDLQEAGNIEQDSDIVMLLYREEVYSEVPEDRRGETKVIFAKSRDGSEGYKLLQFNAEISSFSSWGGGRTPPPARDHRRDAAQDFLGDE